MFKQWVKTGLYGVAGTIRSIDFEWDVTNAKPVLDKFGLLTKDTVLSDEDLAVVVGEIAAAPGVPEALRDFLHLTVAILRNRWVDFEWPMNKFRPIYDALKKWWEDNKFTNIELSSWIETIADTYGQS